MVLLLKASSRRGYPEQLAQLAIVYTSLLVSLYTAVYVLKQYSSSTLLMGTMWELNLKPLGYEVNFLTSIAAP